MTDGLRLADPDVLGAVAGVILALPSTRVTVLAAIRGSGGFGEPTRRNQFGGLR